MNYRRFLGRQLYKRYDKLLSGRFHGFRLLFLATDAPRMAALGRAVRELVPSDFVWVAAQEHMFEHGLGGPIWVRGGNINASPESILGPIRACATPLPPIR